MKLPLQVIYSIEDYLLLLQPLLGRVYILLHSHIDELILGLRLHHARPLLPDPLDRLWDVNVTVETWSTHVHAHIQKLAPRVHKDLESLSHKKSSLSL